MSRVRFGFAVVAVCAATSAARAQESSPRSVAASEFQRGVALAKSGDLAAAVDAFQRAYSASPHHATLYNLGQAYIGLGKPVEAVDALERYLKEGDVEVAPERRQEVEALIARQRERVGIVEVSVIPEDSEVFVDGKRIDVGSMPGRLPLAAGHHVLAARKSSYSQRIESFELVGQQSTRISLTLEPPPSVLGQLRIRCELPGVGLSVDGEDKGTTPFAAALVVPAGNRDVRFVRRGYRTFETSVVVPEARVAQVPCTMRAELSGVRAARLTVSASEPFARVTVDGLAYAGAPLPPGTHLVRVDRSGFRSWSRVVALEPGSRQVVVALLEPTADHRAELEAQARNQRTVAIGFGAAGVVLGGVSAGLFVWNNGRYDDFANEPGGFTASQSASIQRVDDIAVATAVTSAAALVSAGVLWFTSDR